MRVLGFIVLLVLILPSCKRECRKVVDTYEGGKEKVVHEMPDCNDSNTYTRFYYHENGHLGSQAQYVNGVTNGISKTWYENGALSAEWTEKNGEEHGPFKCYNENGKLIREGNAKHGLEHGVVKEWDDAGVKIRMYENGVINGSVYEKWYDSTEAKIMIVIGQYVNGKEEGVWKGFNDDSTIWFTHTYKAGFMTGEAVYYKKGQVDYIGGTKDGEQVGEWKYYDTDGSLTEIRYYDNGKLIRTKKL